MGAGLLGGKTKTTKLSKDLATPGIGQIHKPSYSLSVAMLVASHFQADKTHVLGFLHGM